MDAHPDHEAFVRDGFVLKDFSAMTSGDVVALLSMASGYPESLTVGAKSVALRQLKLPNLFLPKRCASKNHGKRSPPNHAFY